MVKVRQRYGAAAAAGQQAHSDGEGSGAANRPGRRTSEAKQAGDGEEIEEEGQRRGICRVLLIELRRRRPGGGCEKGGGGGGGRRWSRLLTRLVSIRGRVGRRR